MAFFKASTENTFTLPFSSVVSSNFVYKLRPVSLSLTASFSSLAMAVVSKGFSLNSELPR